MKSPNSEPILNQIDEEVLFILTRIPLMSIKQIHRIIDTKIKVPSLSRRLRALESKSIIGSYGGINVGFRWLIIFKRRQPFDCFICFQLAIEGLFTTSGLDMD